MSRPRDLDRRSQSAGSRSTTLQIRSGDMVTWTSPEDSRRSATVTHREKETRVNGESDNFLDSVCKWVSWIFN
jgi:hypothetical protein